MGEVHLPPWLIDLNNRIDKGFSKIDERLTAIDDRTRANEIQLATITRQNGHGGITTKFVVVICAALMAALEIAKQAIGLAGR
jgi:hypothetical protein